MKVTLKQLFETVCENFMSIKCPEMLQEQIAVKQIAVTLLKTDLFPWNFGTAIPQPDVLF